MANENTTNEANEEETKLDKIREKLVDDICELRPDERVKVLKFMRLLNAGDPRIEALHMKLDCGLITMEEYSRAIKAILGDDVEEIEIQEPEPVKPCWSYITRTKKAIRLFNKLPGDKQQQIIDLIDRFLAAQDSFQLGLQEILEFPTEIEIQEPELVE